VRMRGGSCEATQVRPGSLISYCSSKMLVFLVALLAIQMV
jgi:hypothetical protein